MFSFLKPVLSKNASIEPDTRLVIGKRCGALGIILNILLFAAKLSAGLFSKSLAVCADAFNNLTDASSSIVSLIGFKIAACDADSEHPFGHARAEYISGLVVSIVIILIGFELLRESFARIIRPEPVSFTPVVLIVLCAAILIKLFMMFYNLRVGKIISSKTLLATASDSRNDAIATTAVLICAVLSYFTSIDLDGVFGALVALFVIISGAFLVKETMSPLLGEAPDPETVARIKEKILSYPNVIGTHDLIIHDYGPGRRFASVHVEMPAEADILKSHETIDDIERYFLAHDNINLIIHLDPIVTNDNSSLRCLVEEIAKGIDPGFTVHDLRVIPSKVDIHVVFDCVKPASCLLSEEEITSRFRSELSKINPSYVPIVTIDSSFAPVQHF